MTKGNTAMLAKCRKNSKKMRDDYEKEKLKKPAVRRKDLLLAETYLYQTDSQGRTIRASGTLQLKKGIRSAYLQRKAGGKSRRIGDHGGHMFGARFGGSPKLINVVAQHGGLNVGAWKKMENLWARAVGAGKTVTVFIELIYDGVNERPKEFEVLYIIDGKESFETFENESGQVFSS